MIHFLTMLLGLNIGISQGQKIIWDNTVDVVYPDYDISAKASEVRFPNWFLIYPGTKWCGAGNIAENFDDLGEEALTDKCCRSHDNCADVIPAHETKYNLTNPSFYSRLHCDCDNEFKHCLKTIGTKTAKQVGYIYFSVLGTKCFKKEYPIKRCSKYTFFPTKKCVNYKLDTTQEPTYQWFDVPNF